MSLWSHEPLPAGLAAPGARPLRRGAGRRRAGGRPPAWRAGRDELLAAPPRLPAAARGPARLHGLRVAPYDPAYRFEVEVDPDVEPHRLEVPTATDGVVPFERIGVLHLPDIGDLDVWWLDSYGGGIFVPVKDALAGTETYGAGRYLLDTVKGADLGGDVDLATGRGTWSST